MADITVTATSVALGAGAQKQTAILGATVTAGQSVYLDSSNLVQLAKADSTTHAAAAGIALNGGVAGQPCTFQTGGTITIGATVVVGTVYVVSGATAGGIAPWADLSTAGIVTILGVAATAGTIALSIIPTGIAHA